MFVKLITSTITTPSHWWCFDVSYHCVVLVSFHSLDLRIWSKYKNFPNFRKIFTSLVAAEVHAENHCRASKGCLAEQSLPSQAELPLLHISSTSTLRFLRRKYCARADGVVDITVEEKVCEYFCSCLLSPAGGHRSSLTGRGGLLLLRRSLPSACLPWPARCASPNQWGESSLRWGTLLDFDADGQS